MKVDVLVVGAGPGGSMCALECARAGMKVLLIDTKKNIGEPVQCAEFIPLQLSYSLKGIDYQSAIKQEVKKMVHFTPWGEVGECDSPGYVLDRAAFDKAIASRALEEGAVLSLKTKFLGWEDGLAVLKRLKTGEVLKLKAEFVVGADGPRSVVAKLTGEGNSYFLLSAQRTMRLNKEVKELWVFFRSYIPGGYGWVFPKGELANVGVGIDPKFNFSLDFALQEFLKELRALKVVDEVFGSTGGWLPANGLLRLVRKNVVLVGDAGGFCHPITGAGIANAVLSGALAGKSLAMGKLEQYEEEASEVFAPPLERAKKKRELHMQSWDRLEKIVPLTWIGFDEYWNKI
ncbi:MAG: NAD(P)/FAD-dependent oxidoreductase [Aquificaceae bacterium]|nr:NAD(P)/FAD-dependent oxidoreductase [Aquificaceae bacterium]MDW8237021.1 NAD(P)/FAD-dependent oxidoreductase [Aquificaceae bacterium]